MQKQTKNNLTTQGGGNKNFTQPLRARAGFTILYAVVVVSVVLSLGVTIEGIFQRQSKLVGSSQESSEAFYAADTGIECSLYHDWNKNSFETNSPGSVNCAGDTANISESGGTYTYQLNDTAGADVCTYVEVNKTEEDKGIRTRIEARGYNTCGQSQRQAERALRTSYLRPYPEFAEAGTVTVSNDTWESVSFAGRYTSSPLVFATTQTVNSSEEDISAQIRGATASSFEARICENHGGDACDGHTSETVGYIAADADRVNSFNGMESGTVSIPAGTEATSNVSFNTTFANTPYVYAMTQTDNDVGDPQALRVYNVSTTGFTVEYCDQYGTDGCEDHGSETVGYWAIDPVEAEQKYSFDWGKVIDVGGYTWENISFSRTYSSPPVVLTTVQGNGGGQQALYPQVRNVDSDGAQLRFCESDNTDDCDTHATNDMVWISAPRKLIYP